MKILKIFGIVVGIHVFALILIFANPGCSSTTKPPPAPADTVAKADAAPTITVPNITPTAPPSDPSGIAPLPPASFNPDAPATYAGSGPGVRFTPTRPNTPAASAVQQQPVTDVTPAATYQVKAGDSLWTIAKKNHIAVTDLASANNLKTSSVLHQGQKLIIPGKALTPAKSSAAVTAGTATSSTTEKTGEMAAAPKSGSGSELTHTVKPGETIGTIARKYGVTARDIEVRNNITDPAKLRAGTELTIPGWKSTGKGSKASSSDTAKSQPKPAEPKAPVNILEQPADQNQQPSAPAPTSNVPVIRIDDGSSTPAPKS